jgi:sensor histidine kinase regulating citrate/malate metabolism
MAVVIFSILEIALEKWKKSKREQEREILEQEIQMYENQFEIIRQSQIATRSLKHDMKHHLKMLSDLVSSGDKDAALKYLSDMGAFMDNSEVFVTSGNERIDSILNYMIGKAKSADIHTTWKIQIPEQIEISTFDINVILSNLLDNALNALSDIPNPTLEILMKYDRGILCINIQNNCKNEQPATHYIHSDFEPEKEHGYGLRNVQRIVEKYHGNLTAEYVNDVFNASILLFLPNAEKNQ